jgi:hypothetical protein
MPKGSLTFPADPLASMRDLADLDTADSSVITDSRKPVSTEARTDGRKPASKAVRQAASTDGMLAAVEAALESRAPLIGGVKATVDMAPELSTRAKRYLADHRGQSTRQVLIALFDAFLTEKGY